MSVLDSRCYVKVERFPVSGDCRISLPGVREVKEQVRRRGVITRLSMASAKRARLVFRGLSDRIYTEIGLTYPLECRGKFDGKDVKRHLHVFISWLQEEFPDLVFCWALEFQKNGNPHFHLCVNRTDLNLQEVSLKWARIVGSGIDKHVGAGTHVAAVDRSLGLATYMASYLNKYNQKCVPDGFLNVGRFWGYSRNSVPKEVLMIEYSDPQVALRDLRGVRKARESFAKRAGLKMKGKSKGRFEMGEGLAKGERVWVPPRRWRFGMDKYGFKGFSDIGLLPSDVLDTLVERMEGRIVDNKVPW